MKLKERGTNISEVEVLNISMHGIWLFIRSKEYFLSYNDFPWFRDAKVREIHNLELLYSSHLYWPDLDIDLHIESIENPLKYPLFYK